MFEKSLIKLQYPATLDDKTPCQNGKRHMVLWIQWCQSAYATSTTRKKTFGLLRKCGRNEQLYTIVTNQYTVVVVYHLWLLSICMAMHTLAVLIPAEASGKIPEYAQNFPWAAIPRCRRLGPLRCSMRTRCTRHESPEDSEGSCHESLFQSLFHHFRSIVTPCHERARQTTTSVGGERWQSKTFLGMIWWSASEEFLGVLNESIVVAGKITVISQRISSISTKQMNIGILRPPALALLAPLSVLMGSWYGCVWRVLDIRCEIWHGKSQLVYQCLSSKHSAHRPNFGPGVRGSRHLNPGP